MIDLNKKILIAVLLAGVMLLPIGTALASKPVDVTAVLYCEAEVIESRVAGNNAFSYRELDCSFTSGDVMGTVDREVNIHLNQLLNSPNGPVFPLFVGTVQQVLYVTDAEVTIDDALAVGSFVIEATGKVGNVKWRIMSSDVTVNGEPVKLHGNGDVIINYVIPTGPTTYIIENTLVGQVSFTP